MLAKKKYLARWGSGKQDEYKRWEEQRDANNNVFGAGASSVIDVDYPASNNNYFIFSYKTGKKTSSTTNSWGDSSRPVSVYARGVQNNWLASSAGLAFNGDGWGSKINLSLADIGVSCSSYVGENTTQNFGVSVSLLEGTVSFYNNTVVDVGNNTTETAYQTFSIDLKPILFFWAGASAVSGAGAGTPTPAPATP
ncbi:hypothetical protein [Solibaculum mannosilyticum]|uniref:hypothetical protein n=1 Tax=Solibaculum mannosilyticum TaxID=2780922 RepID=UPI0007A8B6FF|nr:hypothetical protein BN3661_00590 [Eubacteriaceae bacterium CHKCI005]